jgi:SAM-dependent methyltransferase
MAKEIIAEDIKEDEVGNKQTRSVKIYRKLSNHKYLKELQKNWDDFGRTDPLWAICTIPNKKGNRWIEDEFFETGKVEISEIIRYIESLDISIPYRKALDFGCGVGRISQALANYFDVVYGVDIAPSMIDLAKKYNVYGDRCRYHLNETDDLKLFQDNYFDFIYSSITLQHIRPRCMKNYIKEFLRVLNRGGLLIFQLPSDCIERISFLHNIRMKVRSLLKKCLKQPMMELYSLKKKKVIKILE